MGPETPGKAFSRTRKLIKYAKHRVKLHGLYYNSGVFFNVIQGTTCRYYQKVHTIRTQTSLRYHGLATAWDIEDLVTLGGQIKVQL